jgi:hypothetical protein
MQLRLALVNYATDNLEDLDKFLDSNPDKEFKIPFGTFALVIHKNPIELWEILVNGFEPYIHSWSNPNEKLDDAVSLLQKGGLLVIDIISLLSLYKLGLADIAVQALGKFGIAQSTLDLLQHMVEECQGWGADGYSIFGTVNGQQVMHLFNPEQVAQKKLYFEQIISWVRNNCLILPCQRALTINVDERKKRNEVLGLSFADTALIAGETGRILYSDDQWLRFLIFCSHTTGVFPKKPVAITVRIFFAIHFKI